MPAASAPPNEVLRLAALRGTGILDTPPETAFDEIVREAASVTNTSMAVLSFICEDRQWFKSSVGFGLKEVSRESAFCAWAIHTAEVLWVDDATKSDVFFDNPFVEGEPYIRHYAGVPIATPDGYLIGTICVFDPRPRRFDPAIPPVLKRLSDRATNLLRHRAFERAQGIGT